MMAGHLSVTSELSALLVFSLKSSTSLHQTIKGFNSRKRSVRELREEVRALALVLSSLNDEFSARQCDFTALTLPLLRCGNACEHFEAIVLACVDIEGGVRANFDNWARVKYLEDDITAFKDNIVGYRSTFMIALCSEDMRTSNMTSRILNIYQEKISETMSDLEESLENIDGKLQGIVVQDPDNEPGAVVRELKDEKVCILKCLDICTEVASHIESVRAQVPQIRNTQRALSHTDKDLDGVLSQLTKSLEEDKYRQQILRRHPTSSKQQSQRSDVQAEPESIKESLTYGAEASEQARSDRTNIFEDITMADDGHQVIVSTLGDLISARNISVGARSSQWLGQMSDDSLQQLSQARYQCD